MAYNFSPFKERLKAAELWLQKEFSSLRTGRANPALLDGVQVESYGAWMPIPQVGSVSIEDARTIRIAPWDASQSKHVEKAITAANLGVSCVVDEKGVRVIFPELTSERREQILKVGKQKLEEARVTLRQERDKVKNDIEKQKKDGTMREDDATRAKADMQKLIDESNARLDEMLAKKEKEISN